ncbi:hypothetical protein GCM10009654_14690 [Streptomyces hebeiensis]|uniref:Uncharacterized protein n=1 Tax=Streptomyces hebeiensis TaxID=229486 RepID=A0ABN1UNC5_9ACTN
MFERVRQRLLDDPVDRELSARRYGPRGAVDRETYRQAGRSGALDQAVQVRETGLRSEFGRGGRPGTGGRPGSLAQYVEEAAQLRECLAARGADGL